MDSVPAYRLIYIKNYRSNRADNIKNGFFKDEAIPMEKLFLLDPDY